MPAFIAPVQMTSQSGCATYFDRPHHPPLVGAHRMVFPIRLTVDAEDIGYLPRRPGHRSLSGDRARQRIQGACGLVNVAHGYVRVAGSGRHTSMTQKQLYFSQIFSGFQEMGSKGMPEGMGSNVFA